MAQCAVTGSGLANDNETGTFNVRVPVLPSAIVAEPGTITGVAGAPAVIRPIESLPWSVNHRAPSGPAVIAPGLADAGSGVVGDGSGGGDPPDRAVGRLVNHRAPSGPAAIAFGKLMPAPV